MKKLMYLLALVTFVLISMSSCSERTRRTAQTQTPSHISYSIVNGELMVDKEEIKSAEDLSEIRFIMRRYKIEDLVVY